MSSHLLDDDEDLRARRERELTLSTGSILGIFFGLVLLCGLFFAFGYNMGSKAHQPQLNATTGEPEAGNNSAFEKFNKPSAGSPAGSSSAPVPTAANSTPAVTTPPPAATTAANTPARETESAPAAPAPLPHAQPVTAPARPVAEPMPSTSASGSFVVQIAALSHSGDAQLIVEGLKAKGYPVAARTDPNDKLIHIQVGPFADKKSAEAMRNRLFADGYNAIVK